MRPAGILPNEVDDFSVATGDKIPLTERDMDKVEQLLDWQATCSRYTWLYFETLSI